nr:hypothetical protein [Oscillatoria acuminata]
MSRSLVRLTIFIHFTTTCSQQTTGTHQQTTNRHRFRNSHGVTTATSRVTTATSRVTTATSRVTTATSRVTTATSRVTTATSRVTTATRRSYSNGRGSCTNGLAAIIATSTGNADAHHPDSETAGGKGTQAQTCSRDSKGRCLEVVTIGNPLVANFHTVVKRFFYTVKYCTVANSWELCCGFVSFGIKDSSGVGCDIFIPRGNRRTRWKI